MSVQGSKMAWLAGIALVFSVAAAGCCETKVEQKRAAARDRTMAQLDNIVRDRVESGRTSGIAAGMVFPDGTSRVVAYGNAGGGRTVDADTIFEIGSITKVFTATVLADMTQRGEVKLSEPVARLLPPKVSVPSRNGHRITLVDLATHTSGLPRDPTNLPSRNLERPFAGYTVARLYAFLRTYRLQHDPGSQVLYSNVGEGLLGHALALRAGESYEQLVRERILDPLDMESTGLRFTRDLASHVATGHNADGKVVPPFEMASLAGAGSLRSSLRDMLRFASANLESGSGRLQQAMATAHSPRKRIGPDHIGLNWIISRGIVWHDGGSSGFSSYIGLDPMHHTAIVLLSNSRAESMDDIGFHMLDKRQPLTPAPLTLPRDTLRRYVGVYAAAGTTARITLSAPGLSLRLGSITARLYAVTKTMFVVKLLSAGINFRVDPNGRVSGLVFHDANGKKYVARKIR